MRACFFACLACLLCYNVAVAEPQWVPVKDTSLEVEAGSILDFSSLLPPVATTQERLTLNAQGQWIKASAPHQPLRFLIGSLGFGVNLGGMPDHALTDRYVKQYRMHGYQMVRLDFLESMLMEGRQQDFDFNPEQLDRFYYLVYALKKNGMYLILNGLSNGNGGYGNVAERWISKKNMHAGIYFDAEKQTHWKKLIQTMYGQVNPYTKLTTLQDPVLAGVILVNEGNLVFLNRQGVNPTLKPYFAKWLQQKYGNQAQLVQAWGSELKADELIHKQTISFPKPDAWTSKRMADTQAFFYETEKHTAQWMTQYMRNLGYPGLVTAYNLWHAPAAHASRGQLPWVDMHNYYAHPDYLPNGMMRVNQDSMLGSSANYVRELAMARHWGKPFTVTEHGQVFWNPYRRENSLALPAYAALQGWNGICQHSGAVDLSYAPTVGRKPIIHPFAVGTDPISRVTETLSALLYLRRDVSEANHTVGIRIGPKEAFEQSAHLGSMPADVSKLSLITGVGLDWQAGAPTTTPSQYDAQLDLNGTDIKLLHNTSAKPIQSASNFSTLLDNWMQHYASTLVYPARKIPHLADERFSARVETLKAYGWLSTHNLTDAKQQVYQSDTNQLLLEALQKRMTVITPNTEAVVFAQPAPHSLNQLSVLSAQQGALVAVSAMDKQPLANSKRMLLILATDARNTDMRFTDTTANTATSLGKPPVILLANKIKLAIKSPHKQHFKVYSLNLRGQRMDAINLKQTETSIEFELDIQQLKHGATTYFEITV
jgi:hypothetical protein